jgi:hypothetical protein
MKRLFPLVPLFLTAVLLCAPAAHAQSLEVPSSWAGVWDLEIVETNCDSPIVTDQYSERDTLCTGQTLDAGDFQGYTPECTGNITDLMVSMTCGMSVEAYPGCNVTLTYTLDLTRDGDTVTGTARTELDYVGTCIITSTCTEEQITGVRVGPEPDECSKVPLLAPSWGALKARY